MCIKAARFLLKNKSSFKFEAIILSLEVSKGNTEDNAPAAS